jgi:PII-like signaling protein
MAVYLDSHAHIGHRSLVTELVRRARRAGLAGATVFRGEAGFGHSGAVHRMHLIAEDSPEVLVVVDSPDRIDAFLEDVGDLVTDLLVVLDELDIVDLTAGEDP